MKNKLFIPVLFILMGAVCASDFMGKQAPEFSGKNIDGKEMHLSDYRGKVVLLDFWASWCGPCQQELPFLVDFYKDHKNKDFIVLAVNIDNKKENMRNFLYKNYATHVFPIIYDPDKKIPPLYDLQAMPTSIFIDKKGIVRYVHRGFNDSSKDEFKQELKTLLQEK